MDRTLTIVRIVLLSILVLILSGVLILFMTKGFNFEFGKAELIYDEVIKEEFDKIDIQTESLDIRFEKSNNEEVSVKIYDDEDNEPTVKVEDNTLKVVSKNRRVIHFGFNFKTSEIVISLPSSLYDLVIDSKSGDITSSVDFKTISIKSTSGDIEIGSATDIDIKSTSGDIKVDEGDTIAIESTSGDIFINKVTSKLNIESTSGDIKVSDLSLTDNSTIKAISGDVDIKSDSEDIYYDAHATSGDIKIDNNNRHAEVELEINTKSGDITVRN